VANCQTTMPEAKRGDNAGPAGPRPRCPRFLRRSRGVRPYRLIAIKQCLGDPGDPQGRHDRVRAPYRRETMLAASQLNGLLLDLAEGRNGIRGCQHLRPRTNGEGQRTSTWTTPFKSIPIQERWGYAQHDGPALLFTSRDRRLRKASLQPVQSGWRPSRYSSNKPDQGGSFRDAAGPTRILRYRHAMGAADSSCRDRAGPSRRRRLYRPRRSDGDARPIRPRSAETAATGTGKTETRCGRFSEALTGGQLSGLDRQAPPDRPHGISFISSIRAGPASPLEGRST